MARDSIEVDQLLRLKPQPTNLFCPTLPTHDEKFDGETDHEARNREQRNERRRVNLENECKVIERKGALKDRIPWDTRGRHKGEKPHLFIPRSRSQKNIPSAKPTHTHTHRKKNKPHINCCTNLTSHSQSHATPHLTDSIFSNPRNNHTNHY